MTKDSIQTPYIGPAEKFALNFSISQLETRAVLLRLFLDLKYFSRTALLTRHYFFFQTFPEVPSAQAGTQEILMSNPTRKKMVGIKSQPNPWYLLILQEFLDFSFHSRWLTAAQDFM